MALAMIGSAPLVGALVLVPALVIVARSSSWRRSCSLASAMRPEIILFGDSITQQSFAPGGWGAAVASAFQRTADVRLRGYSGYNTRWALRLLPRVFPATATAPALVTVLLGANDAARPQPLRGMSADASVQHVPLDEYVANLRTIVRAVASVGDGSARLLLITPPPCDEVAWHKWCAGIKGAPADAEPNRNFEHTKMYADAVLALGAELGTPTLDLHGAFTAKPNWRSFLADGLHPNADGGKLIGDVVLAAVLRHFPELSPATYDDDGPERLALDAPDWKNIAAGSAASIDASFAAHDRARERCTSLQPRRP